jgi:glycosyltransferase involved in cell wall biosynthesis
MMRILYISATSEIGGAEISLWEMIKNMNRQWFLPVAILPPLGPLEALLRRDNVDIKTVKMIRFKRTRNALRLIRFLLHVMLYVPRIAAFVKKSGVRLVHSNGVHAHVFGALAAKLAGVPSVWHVRDLTPLGFLGRPLAALSTAVVVPSEAAKLLMQTCVRSTKKLIQIENGLDISELESRFATAPSGAEGYRLGARTRSNRFSIVMVANMTPWKGHDTFIHAAALVADAHADATFQIVGGDIFHENSDYVDRLERLCQDLGLGNEITFTGYREDAPAIMNAADVVVLPSRSEPFGRVLIEAMALRKPVIASNDGGPAEIVIDGTTGLLVAPGDPRDLAEAILTLARDPALRKSMGAAGRKRVQERFTIDRHVAQIERLYMEITTA